MQALPSLGAGREHVGFVISQRHPLPTKELKVVCLYRTYILQLENTDRHFSTIPESVLDLQLWIQRGSLKDLPQEPHTTSASLSER